MFECAEWVHMSTFMCVCVGTVRVMVCLNRKSYTDVNMPYLWLRTKCCTREQRAADHAHNMQGHIILYLFPQLFAMVMQQKHQQLSSVWVELLLSTRVLANVLMFYSLFTKSFSASIFKKERRAMSIYVASHLSCDFYKTLFLLQIPGPLSILRNSSKIISKYGENGEFILLLMGEK